MEMYMHPIRASKNPRLKLKHLRTHYYTDPQNHKNEEPRSEILVPSCPNDGNYTKNIPHLILTNNDCAVNSLKRQETQDNQLPKITKSCVIGNKREATNNNKVNHLTKITESCVIIGNKRKAKAKHQENEEGRTSIALPPKSCHVSLTNKTPDASLANDGLFLNTPKSQLTQGQHLLYV
nr:hypothetical protein Iba_chr06aCG16100 [Ipomoea batatas]